MHRILVINLILKLKIDNSARRYYILSLRIGDCELVVQETTIEWVFYPTKRFYLKGIASVLVQEVI